MVCKLNDLFFCLLHQSYDLQTLLPRLALNIPQVSVTKSEIYGIINQQQ